MVFRDSGTPKEDSMTLDEIRKEIDAIDPALRELLLKRLDCSREVARVKLAAGETNVYRADREAAILARLSEGVPAEKLPSYLSVVRRIMEASRFYQYSLMYERLSAGTARPGEAGTEAYHDRTASASPCAVERGIVHAAPLRVSFRLPDRAGALASLLGFIADMGVSLQDLKMLGRSGEQVSFMLETKPIANPALCAKLVFVLERETQDFIIM